MELGGCHRDRVASESLKYLRSSPLQKMFAAPAVDSGEPTRIFNKADNMVKPVFRKTSNYFLQSDNNNYI